MTYQQILILMILLHIFADFTLQGLFGNLKQKEWWQKMTDDPKYRNDYWAGVVVHAVYWSIIVCLPFFGHPYAWAAILANTVVHAVVDHLKANVRCINLIQDQIAHLAQIVATSVLFY